MERILGVGGRRASRPITDFMMSWQIAGGYAGPPAASYYVDGNVAATGNGSPSHPFLKLSEAITASNTSIGLTANRWWARRNQIFVVGDQEIDEDLTTAAEKCDIIGCGTDLYPYPRILGNHIFTTKCTGMRFINLGFQAQAGTALITIPDLNHGFQAIGCDFWPYLGGSTHAIRLAGNMGVKILGCRIMSCPGDTTLFAEGIKVEVGSAQNHDCMFAGNYIHATEGIHILTGTWSYGGVIDDNIIRATALTINDASDLFVITNNSLISDANATEDGSGVITGNTSLAAGNRITCGDHLNAPWPLEGTLAT